MKNYIISLLVLMSCSSVFAQWQLLGFQDQEIMDILEKDGRMYTFVDTIIYRSDDAGTSWDSISVISDRFLTNLAGCNTVLFASSNWLCAGSCEYPMPCIYRSFDDGVSWDTVYASPGGVGNVVYNQQTWFVVDKYGLYTSPDNGTTWNKVEPDSTAPPQFSTLFTNNDVLYNIFLMSGVHKSMDNGLTWTNLTGDLPSPSTYHFFANSDYMFLYMKDGYYYRSSTRDLSWQPFASDLPHDTFSTRFFGNDEHLLAEHHKDIYYSGDNGETWQQMGREYDPDTGNFFFIYDVLVSNDQAYIATRNGIWMHDLSNPVKIDKGKTLPDNSVLAHNYPNPFNPVTRIHYRIERAGLVKLQVYNVRGAQVAELVNEFQAVGDYSVAFQADGLASGIYFYRLQTANGDMVQKMTLLR